LADSEARFAFCGQVFRHGGIEINEKAEASASWSSSAASKVDVCVYVFSDEVVEPHP
jgi:hypothetical protein